MGAGPPPLEARSGSTETKPTLSLRPSPSIEELKNSLNLSLIIIPKTKWPVVTMDTGGTNDLNLGTLWASSGFPPGLMASLSQFINWMCAVTVKNRTVA